MRRIIGGLIMVASVLGGAYVGIWLMFIQPIIEACKAFDAGILTGTIIAITVLKCVFSGTVGGLISYLGILLGVKVAKL